MFKFHMEKIGTDEKCVMYYDHLGSRLFYEDGSPVIRSRQKYSPAKVKAVKPFSKEYPLIGKRHFNRLKIQMGLSCNYECSYCLQKAVPHADVGTLKKVPEFLKKMPMWFDGGKHKDGTGFKIELWGGEPLAYWKTLVPLATGIKQLYPKCTFSIITNGSLLTKEKVDWLKSMDFSMAISHDGPGQWVRGPDPLENPEMLDIWRYARKVIGDNRFSINPTINKDNPSHAEIVKFFIERFDEKIRLGEGGYALTYNDDAAAAAPLTAEGRQLYSRDAFVYHRSGGLKNFSMIINRRKRFIDTLIYGKLANGIGASCGADSFLVVDIDGNVITCQNVSAAAVSSNGEPHLLGHVDDLDSVRMASSTHWSQRENCMRCPVLQSCKGTCTFLHGDYFKATCDVSFSDHIPVVAAAIEELTGWALTYIDDPRLPPERRDPFGLSLIGKEPPKPKKVFQIKAVK